MCVCVCVLGTFVLKLKVEIQIDLGSGKEQKPSWELVLSSSVPSNKNTEQPIQPKL